VAGTARSVWSMLYWACQSRPTHGMTISTLRSFTSSGRIVAVQRFSAETDEEALTVARKMVKEAPAVARFDLWQRVRHIEGEAPTPRKEKPRG
jgi:hypothetical protein